MKIKIVTFFVLLISLVGMAKVSPKMTKLRCNSITSTLDSTINNGTIENQNLKSITDPPLGNNFQTICVGGTISDLVATGQNIIWYNAPTGGSVLGNSTTLNDGQIVYASQTISGIESTTRLAVTVNVNDPFITANTYVCLGKSTSLTADLPFSSYISGTTYIEIQQDSSGVLQAPPGAIFYNVNFASYGLPTGTNGNYTITSICHAASSMGIVSGLCLGNNSCVLDANNTVFGNPCPNNVKRLYVLATYVYSSETYLWSTGETTQTINPSPTQTTTYWCDVTIYGRTCRKQFTVTVVPNTPTVFSQVPTICSGNALAALPTTSQNGLTGTWTPAIDNTQTTTYTFTPDVGVCGTVEQMTITVKPTPAAPVGDSFQTLCNSENLSNLVATGTNVQWFSTATGGSALASNTSLTDGQIVYAMQTLNGCPSATRLPVTVNVNTIQITADLTTVCSGSPVLLTAAPDPASLLQGTAYVQITQDATGTLQAPPGCIFTAVNFASYGQPSGSNGNYTINPLCNATTSTAVVQSLCIGNNSCTITPTNALFGNPCPGYLKRLYILASYIYNGQTYLWSTGETTATINPSPTQTTTYWCDVTVSGKTCRKEITINVNQKITPTFTQVPYICTGGTLNALPTTSLNSYTGVWSPALDNLNTTTYTFTPDAGQCANTANMTIDVNPYLNPTFAAISPICAGGVLNAIPTTTLNGYTGTWSPALDNQNTTTYTFTPNTGQCSNTGQLTITVNPNILPTFNQVAPICVGATLSALPTTSLNGYTGTWAPALNNTTTTTYTFTPTAGQCATTATMTIVVNPNILPTFTQVAPICSGATLNALPTTSLNSYTGTWSPAPNNTATTTYTFTPTPGLCATTTTMTIVVNPNILPTFNQVAPICAGGTLNALPTTSLNGYTGTWSPALDNQNTTTYTFTPTPGLCATTATMTIVVNPNILPTFNQVAPICAGGTLNALQTTSLNSYTGTWAPALNNTTTTTYTFTPTAGQCATTATMTIVVNPNILPTFTQVAPICAGATLNALPTTSLNSYTGTWSPALNNNTTTTYTFTPTAGQCATTATMTIVVNPNILPTFTQVAPICAGATLNALPTTSNNGYTGTWAPALNNTATTTYTFTPTPGLCATTATMTIVVNPNLLPTFNAINPICDGAALTAIPTTSLNGYTGTWSPALDNHNTTTYTFTPNPGQCAITNTLTIVVNPNILPSFNAVAPICAGATLAALPTTSLNGYTGTWSPALDNHNTTTYTFTPTPGLCATTATMTIVVNPNMLPTFTQVAPICAGGTLNALPTTSINGYTGTWSPALNNQNTTTYTFTPTPGLCATTATMTIVVNPNILPTFATVPSICEGASLNALPTTSLNSFTGSWSPAIDNTQTTTYTFTPDAGQCATTANLTIVVNPYITAVFTPVAPICAGATLNALPTTSQNGYTGSWSPALDNQNTTTYTFTPNVGQCTFTGQMTIVVNPNILPTFDPVAPICAGATLSALPTTSLNGYTGTWSPALNNQNTTTYTFTPTPGLCATTTTLTIVVNPNILPTFTPVAANCAGATLSALPTTSLNGYTGTWSPALDNTQTTTYTFTPDAGQCATIASLTITIIQNVPPVFAAIPSICEGATLNAIPTTSQNGFSGTWSPALDNTLTTTYTFTPNFGQCATSTTLTIVVNPYLDPTFTAVAPICAGATLTALPTTSNNGYSGSWSPALDNQNTTTYTFTPGVGQCSNVGQMTIVVNPNILPTFDAVAPICAGASLAALPTTSLNGYTGTWSPALNNQATTTYTFTPTAGLCATTTTLTIEVIPNVEPTFASVPSICTGAALADLPTTANNGYTGTWSPAINNLATTTYTFTPNTGECATTTTVTIVVNPYLDPTFTAVAPICAGGTLNALPTTSNNGYSGSWSPALDNQNTTTYTFTPGVGQCSNVGQMTITVNPNILPTFNPVAPICAGATLTALPTTSLNGYTGTWSPALDNQNTTTYTFTPTAGLCATTATMTIVVNPNILPTFASVTPICAGGTLNALPTTSLNGYTGTWSPALDNQNTTTYTFTPGVGQCATTATLAITVNPNLLPTFNPVAPICAGATLNALPTTSLNGFTGTWSPALDNQHTTTYTFTPTLGQCATTASLTIEVNPNILPTFTPVEPSCAGIALAALPTTSINGYTGTWSPALDTQNTTTYTFTPSAGQCATTASMTITIIQNTPPTFTPISPICAGNTTTALPTVSNNGYSGSWSPAFNNATTTTYTFTPGFGQCATSAQMTVEVIPNATALFTQVAPICAGNTLLPLPTTSLNGFTGTWSPPLMMNSVTTTYTFTPAYGQCALQAQMTIVVHPYVTPTFDPVAAICIGSPLAALPTTSLNGITGTWSPALNNLATTTYTFTPDAGQCALTAQLTIVVNPKITPTFAAVAPICAGATLNALPTTSLNGYTGIWSPALDNLNTTTYTFTPDAGQCANTASLTIVVNLNLLPTFNAVAPACAGSPVAALPTTSLNGYSGTWSPAIDNQNTTTYTFTPAVGQCAIGTQMTIQINANPATPTGASLQSFCLYENPTLQNVVVTEPNVYWYSAPTSGTLLSTSTALQDATTYYAIQYDPITGCTSPQALAVQVSIKDEVKVIDVFDQSFCLEDNPTVAQLKVNSPNILWYASASGGTPLALDTPLHDGDVLYAVNHNTYTGCESSQRLAITIKVVSCKVEFNNLLTLDGNTQNDNLNIINVEMFPQNHIQIFNRNGQLVWETYGYNNSNNTFIGKANVSDTYQAEAFLPTGVYFFVLKYDNPYRKTNEELKGYLYINNNH
jgi:serine protease inhibitor